MRPPGAATRRCHQLSAKGNEGSPTLEVDAIPSTDVNLADLDARIGPEDEATGEEDPIAKELQKKIRRPVPDGEFIRVQLGDDPKKTVQIGIDLPAEVKDELVKCLKDNADLFAWTVADMPGIAPDVVCHRLALDSSAKWVAQRRRKQSPEKAEAARKAVKDLIEANFVREVKYTTWLSNVVLVKKTNGKYRPQ